METFEINIYWNDLSDEGKDNLLSQPNFELTVDIKNEVIPVGVLNVGAKELM